MYVVIAAARVCLYVCVCFERVTRERERLMVLCVNVVDCVVCVCKIDRNRERERLSF